MATRSQAEAVIREGSGRSSRIENAAVCNTCSTAHVTHVEVENVHHVGPISIRAGCSNVRIRGSVRWIDEAVVELHLGEGHPVRITCAGDTATFALIVVPRAVDLIVTDVETGLCSIDLAGFDSVGQRNCFQIRSHGEAVIVRAQDLGTIFHPAKDDGNVVQARWQEIIN